MGKWYRVIKTVKGIRYAYKQKSWREGDKVKTKSVYLGRADSLENVITTRTQELNPVSSTVNTLQNKDTKNTKFNKEDLLSSSKIKLEDYNISDKGIYTEAKKMRTQLAAWHIRPEKWQPIVLAKGKYIAMKRNQDGSYTVILPRRLPNKNEYIRPVRREFRKAFAAQYLDILQTHRPAHYEQIRTLWDDTHREVKKAMISYLLAQKKSPSIAMTVWIVFTGHIPENLQKRIPREQLGLYDEKKDTRWREQSHDMMADIIGTGAKKTKAKLDKQQKYLETRIKTTLAEYKKMGVLASLRGKKQQKQKYLNKLQAKHRGVKANRYKLASMSALLSEFT